MKVNYNILALFNPFLIAKGSEWRELEKTVRSQAEDYRSFIDFIFIFPLNPLACNSHINISLLFSLVVLSLKPWKRLQSVIGK